MMASELDLYQVTQSQLENVSVALELDFPFVGVPALHGYNKIEARSESEKQSVYDYFATRLSEYLYLHQYQFKVYGLSQEEHNRTLPITMKKNSNGKYEFDIDLQGAQL